MEYFVVDGVVVVPNELSELTSDPHLVSGAQTLDWWIRWLEAKLDKMGT